VNLHVHAGQRRGASWLMKTSEVADGRSYQCDDQEH
jgi:hypothetical protein